MKKIIPLLLVIIFCVCQVRANVYVNNRENKTPSRIEEKKFKGVQEIKIEHAYGNITIKESKLNEVRLEVRYFDNKNRKVSMDVSLKKNVLSLKTNDSKKNYSRGAKIDYILTVPRKINLNVDLSYGNLKIDNLTGSSDLQIEYGNLNANLLGNVSIKGKYNEIVIDKAKGISVICDYSKVKINDAGQIDMKGKYTDYSFNKIECINKGSYSENGSLNINQVKIVDVDLKYSDLCIARLEERLKAVCDYSDVNIRLAYKTLKSIDIKSSLSDVKISLHNSLSAKIDLKTNHGDVNIPKQLDQTYTYIKKDSNKEVRKGALGKGHPTASIDVTTSYADILIK